MKFISAILSSAVILLALAFALANRQDATISLWPFGVEIEAPLYLLTLGTLFFGILLGAVIAWFNLLPHRLRARQLRKDLAELQGKLADVQKTALPPVVIPSVLSNHGHDDDMLEGPKPKWRLWGSRA